MSIALHFTVNLFESWNKIPWMVIKTARDHIDTVCRITTVKATLLASEKPAFPMVSGTFLGFFLAIRPMAHRVPPLFVSVCTCATECFCRENFQNQHSSAPPSGEKKTDEGRFLSMP